MVLRYLDQISFSLERRLHIDQLSGNHVWWNMNRSKETFCHFIARKNFLTKQIVIYLNNTNDRKLSKNLMSIIIHYLYEDALSDSNFDFKNITGMTTLRVRPPHYLLCMHALRYSHQMSIPSLL